MCGRVALTLSAVLAAPVSGTASVLLAMLLRAGHITILGMKCSLLGVQDADLIIMHEQERLVQEKGGWRSAYCMPHHTDAGVLAFR